ncbi:MAG TPA: OmpH family outer membrane protein [Saprospiraceae bacterium]|nr:OmpH family outer membrane protein [Saprospiraceae bacterium]
MNIRSIIFCSLFLIGFVGACSKSPGSSTPAVAGTGLKIAYVNGDSILHKFEQFRKQADVMDEKQRKAEEQLQAKGAALQNEIMAYQKKAKSGSLTPKEMEAQERYLSSKQDAILAERDKIAKAIMEESEVINRELQAVLHKKLDEIKTRDGYDFILNAAEGGSVLAANEKYDITEQVLKMLNEEGTESIAPDTTGKK